jgi:hypothetical protein
MGPLPANQLFTTCLIVGRTGWTTKFRMNWVRTCSWARQIALLAGLLLLAICFCVARRRKRLTVCAIHWGWLSDTSPHGMCRHKCLRLRGDGRENAVLVEPHAVGAAAVFGGLEARASNLYRVSKSG